MSWFSSKKPALPAGKKEEKEEKKEEAAPAVQLPTGGNAEAYRVIASPHVTEKAAQGYAFRVYDDANKTSIKKAINSLYGVTVINVRTIRLPAKRRTIGRFKGVKAGFKKAIITLKQGETI